MHWLYLLLAFAALLVGIKTTSTGLMLLCLLASLVLFLFWAGGLYASRMAGRSRDPSMMIDPEELRRLREQAEARKRAVDSQDPSAP